MSHQHMNKGSTNVTSYVAKAYQIGTTRYKYHITQQLLQAPALAKSYQQITAQLPPWLTCVF